MMKRERTRHTYEKYFITFFLLIVLNLIHLGVLLMIVRCVKKKKRERIKIETTTISQADEYNKIEEGIYCIYFKLSLN